MQREMEIEKTLAVRAEAAKVNVEVKEERVRWIEDEVEELERWDGLE
jgi:hypothetical protein